MAKTHGQRIGGKTWFSPSEPISFNNMEKLSLRKQIATTVAALPQWSDFLNPMNSSTFPELGKRSLLFFLKKIQDAAITSHLMRPLVCRVWHLEGKWKKWKNTFSWSRSEIPADRFHDKATNVTAATSLEDFEHWPSSYESKLFC